MGKQVIRKQRIIRATSEVREPIDRHMIAQILLGPAQVQALTEAAERSDSPGPGPGAWRQDCSVRSPS
jgi:hypothetical protein